MFDQQQETLPAANILTKEALNGSHLRLSLHNFTLPRGKHNTRLIGTFCHFNPDNKKYFKYFP